MSSFYRKTFKVSCSAISFDELDEVHHFLWMNELTDSPKNKWIQDNFVECNADGSSIVVVHCYQQGAAFANCGSVGRGQAFITDPITCPNCLKLKPKDESPPDPDVGVIMTFREYDEYSSKPHRFTDEELKAHDRKIARAALQAILDKLGLEIDVTIP